MQLLNTYGCANVHNVRKNDAAGEPEINYTVPDRRSTGLGELILRHAMKIPGILWKCGNLKSVDRSTKFLAPPIPITDNEVEHRSSSSLSPGVYPSTTDAFGYPRLKLRTNTTSAQSGICVCFFQQLSSRQSFSANKASKSSSLDMSAASYRWHCRRATGAVGKEISASKHLLSRLQSFASLAVPDRRVPCKTAAEP
jgi:hypothetical protein